MLNEPQLFYLLFPVLALQRAVEEKFSITENEYRMLNLTIKNTQLAKGRYYLNFSVGQGNEVTGIKDFDIILQTLFFEVAFKNEERDEMVSIWIRQWGNVNFTDVSID